MADPDHTNIAAVFGTLLQFCATVVRDPALDTPDTYAARSTRILQFSHAFVCQLGLVQADTTSPDHLADVIHTLSVCPVHTYLATGTTPACVCKRHPVVDPAIQAAYAVGGAPAVDGMGHRWAYDGEVAQAWRAMLAMFKDAWAMGRSSVPDPLPRLLLRTLTYHGFRGHELAVLIKFPTSDPPSRKVRTR